jgi:putative addiction module killer protein
MYVTNTVIELREYLDDRGRSPFADWFKRLDGSVALRVRVALSRMRAGYWQSVKGVGGGVLEYRMHTGPGYRIYFGRDGDTLVLLLGGGTKRRQSADIAAAQNRWASYTRRNGEEK